MNRAAGRPAPLRSTKTLRTAAPEVILGILAAAVFIAWAAANGGFATTASSPGALFLIGLLIVFGRARRHSPEPLSSGQRAAVIALSAFALWAFLSILWADDQGIAWDGANRALLYAAVIALFTLPAWSSASAATVMGAYSLGVAVVGAGFFLATTASADPATHFIGIRFAEPTGYHNASVALFSGAFWPALFLSSRREVPWPARGALLAAAGLLLELALIPQSRGWLIAFPVGALLYLAFVPNRLRTVVVALPLAAVVALASGTLLEVAPAAERAIGPSGALDDATTAMLVSATVLFLGGSLLGIVDRTIRVSDSVIRRAHLVVGIGGAAIALAASVIALAVIGNPVTWAGDRWDDFTGGQAEFGSGAVLGQGLGSNRSDFWRVALDEFSDSPIDGGGIDNFAANYLRERHTNEEPQYAHSLPLEVLSGTGVVGVLLLFSSLALLAAGLARAWRAPPDELGRGLVGVAGVAGTYWFLHSGADWLWAMPAVTAPPLAWMAMASRLEPRAPGESRARANVLTSRVRLIVVPVALFGVFAATTYGLPWAAARDVEKAQQIWPHDPGAAFERLDRASDLNFLSSGPDLAAGAIAGQLSELGRARSSFQAALDREPLNWYARLELGGIAALEGHRALAINQLRSARRLNPRDPTIKLVLERTRAGRPLSLPEINVVLAKAICDRLGRTPGTAACPS